MNKEQSIKDEFEKQFKCDKKECKDCATLKAGCKTLCKMCDVRKYYYVIHLETLLTTKYIKRSEIDKDIKGILVLNELLKTPSVVIRDALIKLKSKLEVKP